MKQFQYRARDKTGALVNGLIESISPDVAARTLQERKLLVINITEKQAFDLKKISFSKKVSPREIANFTRMLATMLSTGLPLTEALTDLVAQSSSGQFKEILQSILHDIQSGVSLSEAMGRNGNAFDELYINLIKAGEAAGKMDESLAKLADTLESNLDFQSKVKGAMIYPLVIVIAMALIGIFMITSIIPKISDVYKEFGADLPAPTQFLVNLSYFMTHYTVVVLAIIVIIFFSVRTLRKNPTSEYAMNNLAFKFPILGPLSEEVTLAVVSRTLGTLLSSGVAILDALRIVAKTVANNRYRAGLQTAAAYVEKGLPLSVALKKNPDFPVLMAQLIAIGEETGTVDQSLERVAKFYQDSAERKVKALTTLLEPMMILMMGAMVGGLALAVLLPMFNLVNVIK